MLALRELDFFFFFLSNATMGVFSDPQFPPFHNRHYNNIYMIRVI